MINQLQNTPGAYKEFWKTLASSHINIDHQEGAAERFVVINEGELNPFNGVDLGELIKKQRSTLKYGAVPGEDKKLLMTLVEWASDMEELPTRPMDIVDGSFILLGKVNIGNYDEKRIIQDLAFNVGRELMAWVVQFFEMNSRLGTHGDVQCDAIGPVTNDNLYGYRYDFKWNLMSTLEYDVDNFQGFEPSRVI